MSEVGAPMPGCTRRLRLAALVEGSTLLLLVFIAVPMKHLAGIPIASAWMGPVHGAAFLFYLWTLAAVATEDDWPLTRALRWGAAAMVPFGTFVALHLYGRRGSIFTSKG